MEYPDGEEGGMKKIILTAVVLSAALAARAAEGTKREFPADGLKLAVGLAKVVDLDRRAARHGLA